MSHVHMETHTIHLEEKLHCCIGFRSYSNWICAYENIAEAKSANKCNFLKTYFVMSIYGVGKMCTFQKML